MTMGKGRVRETTPDEKKLVLAALRESRPRQFEVIERYLRGMDQVAIGKDLGISQSTVSRRLAAAKVSLEKLRRHYIQRADRQA